MNLQGAVFSYTINLTLETHGGGNWSNAVFDNAVIDTFKAGVSSSGIFDVAPNGATLMAGVSFAGASFPNDYIFAQVNLITVPRRSHHGFGLFSRAHWGRRLCGGHHI